MTERVSDTLAATGAGSQITISQGWLQLSGTWTGTVNIQTGPDNAGNWSNMTDATGAAIALTTNTNCPIDNAISTTMRVNWTRVSGTLVATITGINGTIIL